jgi:hypothetical protein
MMGVRVRRTWERVEVCLYIVRTLSIENRKSKDPKQTSMITSHMKYEA